ncbi:response regulator [Photobacterium sp. TLY01]|uniref:response regulator n=1 Tax=Photobacterium sp. TLY01 TaxID=2907534 RepID=UPI001F2D83AE|nr:response regulator [Photobacterium sp. TLY01]UIP27245.1 response regulator [Photobacterium sp. TLY01]
MTTRLHTLSLAPPPWHKLKVLLVDDQPSAQSLMKGVLVQIGLRHIDTAANYRDAIRHGQRSAYDLLLVDYHLDNTLTGSELVTLLRKKQLLSANCGIVIFSADTSARVVLNALAVEPDAFVTLPLPLNTLQQKLSHAWRNSQTRLPVYKKLSEHGLDQGIRHCKQQLLQHGPDHQLESLLLDMLMEKKDWAQARRYIALFQSYHPSVKVTLAEARIEHQCGHSARARQLLIDLIGKQPLCLEAMDLLANYQAAQGHPLQALATAQRALKLSPSASHRALKVAQLAAECQQPDAFAQAGLSLATHLPIIDVGWIICLAEFSASFEQLYFSLDDPRTRRQLRQTLAQIAQRAHHRLLPAQRPFLYCFKQLLSARLLLAQGKPLKAKRRLLLGLSGYFDRLNKLPSVILADALPLLLQLGETRLIADICQVLKHRDSFDGHSQFRLQALRENTHAFDALRWLESTFKRAQAIRHTQPSQALFHFDAIIHDYPLCSEAHLGRLDCLLRLQSPGLAGQVRPSLLAVTMMPLPDTLAQWRSEILNQMRAGKLSDPAAGSLSVPLPYSVNRDLPPVRIEIWAPLLH